MTKTGVFAVVAAAAVALSAGSVLADGDVKKGKKVFKKCLACHTVKPGKNKVGPSLHGVIGRSAGTVDGFKYSKAMKESGVTWTPENIATYLKKPKDFIKKNKMAFVGLKKDDDIEDVISYIESESK